ncbi:N-acetylglucosamine kinase [Paractinoplanes toevensis]|uniref:Kinase n=1 Tax=Paractinoplanes toevensis TaxID=571911 RepID=A0A919W436_9ACTN|nr:BadF/BadG/BcrA/BcrD ATPase family protein [Actinoplanes toevensis]GIM93469.1 kinase [Actinoplanes toevensis]
MRALYLAADGGNSKTDVVLGDASGQVLGFVRGGTSSPHNIGLPGTVEVLGRLIRDVHADAGLPLGTPIDTIAVYLAGADLPIEVSRLHEVIAAEAWAGTTIVDNDCFALLRAGTAMPDAVTVVCGAGTNCVGRAADGRTARFPALGPISGDWGGGHDLADHALREAVRGEDGRGRSTALSAAVAAHFGLPTVEAVSIALHLGDLPMERIHELSPLLFAVAATGDEVASALIDRQAAEILAQHRVAAARLDLLTRPHALVLGGGVMRARHPQLNDQIKAGARRQAPLVEVSVLSTPPVTGAALLALDAMGRAPVAEPTLRTALANRTPTPAPQVPTVTLTSTTDRATLPAPTANLTAFPGQVATPAAIPAPAAKLARLDPIAD